MFAGVGGSDDRVGLLRSEHVDEPSQDVMKNTTRIFVLPRTSIGGRHGRTSTPSIRRGIAS
jgi:hypothetical protein